MKHKILRLTTALVISIMAMMLFVTPALAIDDPNVIDISSVFVYRHCLENNDQLYIVEYELTYTIDNPDESVTQAFLCRLMDGPIELGVTAPYAFHNNGYGKGIFAIYFSALDAPDWNGAYTMRLEGNPTLSWTGAPPSTFIDVFDSWSTSSGIPTTQNELSARILYLANLYETEWTLDMVTTGATGSYLTTYGEMYFTTAIPGLQTMAPTAFSGTALSPDWNRQTFTQTYAEELAAGVEGTPLDVAPAATEFGLSRMWMSSALYLLGSVILIFLLSRGIGSSRAAILLSIPLVVAGALLGMLPLVLAIMMGFAALVFTGFALFYHPSGA